MTEEQRNATLKDGQDAGGLLLDIEGRIGELALKEKRAMHKVDVRGSERDGNLLRGGAKPSGKPPKHERLNIPTARRMQVAQRIAKNPAAVKRICLKHAQGCFLIFTLKSI